MMKTIILKIDALISTKAVLWVMVALGSLVYGLLCCGSTIWLDEALTGSIVRQGWWELICFTTTDIHPPLYYLINKLGITIFGDHLFVSKMISYIPFVFALLLTATKVRKNYGEKVAFVLLALLCTTPCVIDRNVEVRMYQWAFFFVYAFAIYLFAATNNKSRGEWLICLFYGMGAAYTHYYALITVAILYIIVFVTYIKERDIFTGIIKNVIASVIGYLPWLFVFWGQANALKETGWWQNEPLRIEDVYAFFVWPFDDNTGYESSFFILLLFLVVLFVISKKTKYKVVILGCIGTYFLFIGGGILISLFYQPIFVTRFIYPVVGVLLIGLALVVAQWRTEFICLFSLIILLFGAKTYNSQLHYQFNKDSIPKFISIMDDVDKEETVILCEDDVLKCIVEYLYPDYFIENADEVSRSAVEGKVVYYLAFDTENVEDNRLEHLGLKEYKWIDNIYVRYHSFDVYSVWTER